MRWLAIFLLILPSLAWAQAGDVGDCSVTVGTGAVALTFPASGKTGNPKPSTYLEICDSHATQTLGVNWVGGTAQIGSQGTLTLDPSKGIACKRWTVNDGAIPFTVSVIGSGSSTTTACGYK